VNRNKPVLIKIDTLMHYEINKLSSHTSLLKNDEKFPSKPNFKKILSNLEEEESKDKKSQSKNTKHNRFEENDEEFEFQSEDNSFSRDSVPKGDQACNQEKSILPIEETKNIKKGYQLMVTSHQNLDQPLESREEEKKIRLDDSDSHFENSDESLEKGVEVRALLKRDFSKDKLSNKLRDKVIGKS